MNEQDSFLSSSSIKHFKWVCNLWNKWLETSQDETLLKVSLDSIFDQFPAVAPNYLALFINEAKTMEGKEFKPTTLYHIAATVQMYLRDQSKGIKNFPSSKY